MNITKQKKHSLQFLTRIYVFLLDLFLLSNSFMKSLISVIFLVNIKVRVLISIVY